VVPELSKLAKKPSFWQCNLLISFERGWPNKTGFALYQGPTLVGPLRPNKDVGFSPCVQAEPEAGAKAQFSFHPLRPDYSRALIQSKLSEARPAIKTCM
jgi:hypothetical protein